MKKYIAKVTENIQISNYIEHCLNDAIERSNQNSKIQYISSDFNLYTWPQTWSDTSCGWGGVAGQMITSAQTVVIFSTATFDFYVYHGRFAYKVNKPTRKFMEAMSSFSVPSVRKINSEYGEISIWN